MKSVHRALIVLAVLLAVTPQLQAQSSEASLDTEENKILYALGMAVAQNLAQFNLTKDEAAVVQQGFVDTVLNREAKVDLMQYGPKLQQFAQERKTALVDAEKAAGTKFLEEKAAEAGAVRTESGMIYKEITPGAGASPKETDTVKVHYRGTLRDGTEFDSSYGRGTPTSFPLNRVIKCWTEGLQTIKVGGKSQLVCPSDIAYGDQGNPSIPGGAVLVFEVELLEIEAAPAE